MSYEELAQKIVTAILDDVDAAADALADRLYVIVLGVLEDSAGSSS